VASSAENFRMASSDGRAIFFPGKVAWDNDGGE
jgi:hypothetical protein